MTRPVSATVAPAVALVLSVALVLTGCGGDDEPTTDTATTTLAPASDDPSSTPTTGTTAPPDTGPSQPTAFTTTARDAVNELKTAWETGDRPRATAIAPGDSVDALFHLSPDGYEVYGCDTGEFETSTCNFRNRSTGTQIGVSAQRHPEGWQITTVNVSSGG